MKNVSSKTNVPLTVMIEESENDKNFSAYIPELRLGAIGDTVEEAKENVLDLAIMELERRRNISLSKAPIIERIEIAV